MLPVHHTHHLIHHALHRINAAPGNTQPRTNARPAPTPNALTRLIGRIAAAQRTPPHWSLP